MTVWLILAYLIGYISVGDVGILSLHAYIYQAGFWCDGYYRRQLPYFILNRDPDLPHDN